MHLPDNFAIIDVETTGLDWRKDLLHGIGVVSSSGVREYFTNFNNPALKAILADKNIAKVGHNIRFDLRFIKKQKLKLAGEIWDTRVLAHLLDENNSCSLKVLAPRYLGQDRLRNKSELDELIRVLNVGHVGNLCAKDLLFPNNLRPYTSTIAKYCLEDCDNTRDLLFALIDKHKQRKLTLERLGYTKTPVDYFVEEARPFSACLFQIETHGIRVDTGRLAELTNKLIADKATQIAALAGTEQEAQMRVAEHFTEVARTKHLAKLKTEAGKQKYLASDKDIVTFDWNKNQHVERLLSAEWRVPADLFKKTPKGGRSVDEGSLRAIAAAVSPKRKELLELFLEYKYTCKLLTSYIGQVGGVGSGVAECLDPETERVYPEYSEFIVTGRLSASKPAIQTLPRKSGIKRLFIADKDHVIVHADASQIELRVAAHLSQDPLFVDAYKLGRDLHKQTAAAMFNVDEEDVTPEQRQAGKSTNFLLIYAGGPARLQQQLFEQAGLSYTLDECKDFRAAFFKKYLAYHKFLARSLEQATKLRASVAESGRVRLLPDLALSECVDRRQQKWTGPQEKWQKLRDEMQLQGLRDLSTKAVLDQAFKRLAHAQKQAYNFPVQSLAASITKRAIIDLFKAGYRVICTVHDSVDVLLPESRLDEAAQIKHILEQSYKLSVPVVWDVKLLNSFEEEDKYVAR